MKYLDRAEEAEFILSIKIKIIYNILMHEMGIAQNILEIILEEAEKANAKSINRINMQVGELAGIQVDSLKFCFDVIKKETIASAAEMLVENCRVVIECNKCNTVYKDVEFPWMCDNCQTIKYDIISGKEFQIINLDVD